MNKNNLKIITYIALFSAFIFVSSKIEFRFSGTRFHLGNTMCLLSSLILSPITSGLSAGIGSFLFDIVFYPSELPFEFLITFLNKFLLSFTTSYVFHKLFLSNKKLLFIIISSLIGQIVYIILYLSKTLIQNKIILNLPNETIIINIISKLIVSSINAIVAIILSTIIYNSIHKYIRVNYEQN